MTLAFQKFGLRAYVDREEVDEAAAEALASQLVRTIGRALPLLRKTVLTQIADEQVAHGEVNIDNHFPRLKAQYEHFRELSKASTLAADTAVPIREQHPGPPPSISVRYPDYQLRQHAQYEANAAMNAFFSMLEHLLLIEYLLSGREARDGRLASFIASGWSAKFKLVVDLGVGRAKVHYDGLVAIHDQVRNRSIHGEIHSDGTDFSFLLPGVGPVSTRLVTSGGKRSYRWGAASSSAVLDELAEVATWLAAGPLGAAVAYGQSGLPLFFGGGIREELVGARHDPTSLSETIDIIGRMVDDAANMDW